MGIDVKMVTGDHIAIAKQIARELRSVYQYQASYLISKSS